MEISAPILMSLLALLVAGPVGWIVRGLVNDNREIRKDIANYKIHVAENYVDKDDLHRELGEIKDMLKRVFVKLDEGHRCP